MSRSAPLSEGVEQLILEIDDHVAEHGLDRPQFDVVIVGSGYGGAVAAARLAEWKGQDGARLSVCVLERGREFLQGMFPERFADLPGEVRLNWHDDPTPKGRRDGLFDLRLGENVAALVGNGLGGGSLINAGVLVEPASEVFESGWPSEIVEDIKKGCMKACFNAAELALGANKVPTKPAKLLALEALAQQIEPGPPTDRRAKIAVSVAAGENQEDVFQQACIGCGDCFTGCNHGAKNTLPVNYLACAQHNGARLFTGTTVVRVEQGAGVWRLLLAVTGKEAAERVAKKRSAAPNGNRREPKPIYLTAARVILAAGTFGSTEILMRSKEAGLALSDELGKRFSTNGDMIAVGYKMHHRVNASAREAQAPHERGIGPTITGMIDLRDKRGPKIVIEEMAIPAALRRLFEETITTAGGLYSLGEWSRGLRTADIGPDRMAIDPVAVDHTAVYATMGDDGAAGRLELVKNGAKPGRDARAEFAGDGGITVHWPEVARQDVFRQAVEILEKAHTQAGVGGTLIPYPLWRPLPPNLQSLVEDLSGGSVFTAHPLGGCAMGDSVAKGVVDHAGRVFDPVKGKTYDGLVVLDGSIVPKALGINPCLTIAALAERAVARLVTEEKWIPAVSTPRPSPRPLRAPVAVAAAAAAANDDRARPAHPTAVRLAERARGDLTFPGLDRRRGLQQRKARLDIVYRPIPDLAAFIAQHPKILPFERATLRLSFSTPSGPVEKHVPLEGWLSLLQQEESTRLGRILRGTWAFIWNRGWREIARGLVERAIGLLSGARSRDEQSAAPLRPKPSLFSGIGSMLKLASHAGDARLFVYEMRVQGDCAVYGSTLLRRGDRLVARKRLAYTAGGNFWQQLLNLEVTLVPAPTQPGAERSARRDTRLGMLTVDLSHFVKEYAAQLQVVEQESLPSAIADLLSFALYALRVVVGIHIWSFRLPDYPQPEQLDQSPDDKTPECGTAQQPSENPLYAFNDLQSLPGFADTRRIYAAFEGETATEVTLERFHDLKGELAPLCGCRRRLPGPIDDCAPTRWAVALPCRLSESDGDHDKKFPPANILLTRYHRANGGDPVRGNGDAPVLLIHGFGASGTTFTLQTVPQNLVQHLLGRGFDVWVLDLRTSIGLSTSKAQSTFEDVACMDLRVAIDLILSKTNCSRLNVVAHCIGAAMFSMAVLSGSVSRDKIQAVVLSQVGPLVRLPDVNRFRGYMAGYLKAYLNWRELNVTEANRPFVQLVDRLLATYPFEKFRNPFKSESRAHLPFWPWATVPHEAYCNRASAIFGPLFRHANLNRRTLDGLGDLIGHVNFKTFQQTIFFATRRRLTDHLGQNTYISYRTLTEFFDFPVCFVHGSDNQVFSSRGSEQSHALVSSVFESSAQPGTWPRIALASVPGYGHQDCFIGRRAHVDVFPAISKFLEHHAADTGRCARKPAQLRLRAPLLGPVLGWLRPDTAANVYRVRIMFVPDDRATPPTSALSIVLDAAGKHCPGFCCVHPVQRIEDPKLLPGKTQALALASDSAAVRPLRATQLLDVTLPRRARDYKVVVLTVHQDPAVVTKRELGWPLPGSVPRLLSEVEGPLPDELVDQILSACGDPEVRGESSASRAERVSDKDYERQACVAHVSARSLQAIEPDPGAMPTPAEGDANRDKLVFAFGSCRYASSSVDRELADRSFGRLCDLLPSRPAGRRDPQLMLLIGDQIYVDATAGLFDASADFDKFDGHYREAWTAPNAREVLRRLPTYMMLDDHEIQNDVEPEPGTERSALVAFESYQRCLAPPNHHQAPAPHGSKPAYWYTFETNAADFFIADTRTDRHREQRADCLRDTIMGTAQMTALRNWLQRDTADPRRVKFVACPSVVLPLSRGTERSSAYALRSDWWDGFPFSLVRLLTFIAENRIQNVVFLGGDLHCSLATEVELRLNGHCTKVWSIVSSGLYAPYPFANTKAEDVELSYSGSLGDWYGTNGAPHFRDLRLAYETRSFMTENSYALVRIAPSSRAPRNELVVEFDTTAGIRSEEFELS